MEAFEPVLVAARLGESWAFERLFHWLGRPVAAYLRGAGVEDPDGIANEVFLKAFTGIGGFEGDEGRFRSWVFTIAHHAVIDDRRRRSRRPVTAELEHEPATPDEVDVVLGNERIRSLLRTWRRTSAMWCSCGSWPTCRSRTPPSPWARLPTP